MWSLERFLIGRDCETRLALTGTLSSITPVVRSIREGLITGGIFIPEGYNSTAVKGAYRRVLNTRRKADTVIPVSTRLYCDDKGDICDGTGDCIKLCVDFGSITGDTCVLYWVTNKKFQGTPEVKMAYAGIAHALTTVYPSVFRIMIRELILIPMKNGEYDLLQAPEFEVLPDKTVFKKLLKLPSGGGSDRRKCGLATDPCPARGHCPVMNPKK